VSLWVYAARKICALLVEIPFPFYLRSLFLFLSLSFNVDRDRFQCSSLQNYLMIFWGILTRSGLVLALFLNGLFRPNAVAIAALVNWLTNALIGFTYPILDDLIPGYTFFIFGGFCFVSVIYTIVYVPETKGKEISEIQKMFMSNPPSGWFSKWEFY